jgi:signal transduction histidine kinase/CheY-like chemotaxis protein
VAGPPLERLLELLAINRAIAAATEYASLLRLVVERTAAFLAAESAVLVLGDLEGPVGIAASVGLDEARARTFTTEFDEGIGARICRFIACEPERFLAAPVLGSGRIRGLLAVHRRAPVGADVGTDATMLAALADQAAIALANVGHVQKLEEMLVQLRDADRRKDEFLSMLSHEIRNPLAPIRTSIHVLGRVDPQSATAEHARVVIQRQTDYLTRLIDDLLEVTRIARGKVSLSIEPIALVDVVRRAADAQRSMMAERRLNFAMELPEEAIWIQGDATRIAQLVGNLLDNAAKFTPAGGEVVLAIRALERSAELRVRDTGSGIDPELAQQVFEPFAQAEPSLARSHGGLGLGLALVHAIALMHDGAVRAESAGPGMGAEFVVTLPRLTSPRPGLAAVGAADLRGVVRRVLVVDDNRDAAESLAELVALFGHIVEVAYDGPSAVELACASRPDVILCDVGLPGMSGYQVAKAVRARVQRTIRLVAVTGYAQPEDVSRAREAGFDGHIAKPADPAEIDRLLR